MAKNNVYDSKKAYNIFLGMLAETSPEGDEMSKDLIPIIETEGERAGFSSDKIAKDLLIVMAYRINPSKTMEILGKNRTHKILISQSKRKPVKKCKCK